MPGMPVAFRHVKRALVLLPFFAALAGCAAVRGTGPAPVAAAPDAARLARVARLGNEVVGAVGSPAGVRFALSSRDGLGAWSWPDGRVRVGRALVDLLDDAELRAALAHEVGHLVDGGHVSGAPAALSGSGAGTEIEARADVVGCRLLRASGAPTDALPRMLRRVASALEAAPDPDAPDPAALLRRATLADASCVRAD